MAQNLTEKEAITRRGFLSAAATASTLALLPHGMRAASATTQNKLAHDPQRPQFHLLPASNWMNDPNGPIFFNGQYHMFFQYNPHAAVWGDMSWYHSVSPDMLHWKHLPLAFTPTPESPDAFGCFSGSAIQMGSRVYQVYTGTKLSSKPLATIRDGEDKIQESQCLAYSDDPKLIQWTKLPQPIIPRPPAGMSITGFRDPSAWKQGEWYYMTVGSGEANVGGCVLLYRAKDLQDAKSWEYMHKLTSGTWNGRKTANPCSDGEMWECPDFFELDRQHVLIYSTLDKVFWQSGELDAQAMLFHPRKTGELDLGNFYAPKTQLDAHGRRILWGWLRESRSEDAMRAAGWSGMMGLPRMMQLDKDGNLRMHMLPELRTLRGLPLPVEESRAGTRYTLPNASGEVLCTGTAGVAMELTMSDGTGNLLHVKYSPDTHAITVDDKEILLQPGDVPKLHAYIDASVIEVMASERVAYTKRFYSGAAQAPDIAVSALGNGVTLEAWSIRPISSNRLTTPASL